MAVVNRDTRRRRGRRDHALIADPLRPTGYDHPSTMTPGALHERLVADAVKGIATPLAWATAAYERIGAMTHRGADDAFLAVRDEVRALTGLGMPML